MTDIREFADFIRAACDIDSQYDPYDDLVELVATSKSGKSFDPKTWGRLHLTVVPDDRIRVE